VSELPEQLEAIPGFEVQVYDCHARVLFLEDREGLNGLRGNKRNETCLLDEKSEQFEQVSLVIDDQYARALAAVNAHTHLRLRVG